MTGQACEGEAVTVAGRLLDDMARPGEPLTRRERVRRALLLYNLGAFETSRQVYDAGLDHLRTALSEAETLDMPYLQLSCHAQLVEHDFQVGDLSRGADHGHEVLEAAQTRGWSSYHGLTAAHVNLAAIAVLRDDPDTALGHLAEAARTARPVDRINRIRIHVLTATALCDVGRVAEARGTLEQLQEEVTGGDLPAWVPVTVSTVEARRAACEGRPEEGLDLLESVVLEGAGAAAIRSHQVLEAELLLRCDRAGEARDVLTPWTRGAPRRPVSVAALVVDALAAERLGLHDEALDTLDEALRSAAPEQLVRPFVAPRPQVRPLLEGLVDRGTAFEPLALELLEHMPPRDTAQSSASGRSPSYVEPLSDRELEVLRMLQGTLTNVEVAERLYVSVNTLRTHLKSINRKLGVSNRRAAVRRGRELGIL
jgi:LuxR family maltose regulon positive regulatory protein